MLMSISPDLIVTIFVLSALTIPAAIGGVIVYRGTYYKSLPGKVLALEQDADRKDSALKRQAQELELWKGVATQTPELKKLIELFGKHHEQATARFVHIETQHDAILEKEEKMVKQHDEIIKHHTEIINLLLKISSYMERQK